MHWRARIIMVAERGFFHMFLGLQVVNPNKKKIKSAIDKGLNATNVSL